MPHTIFTSQGKLSRRGLISAGNCFTPGLIDNLTYTYGEEGRLTAVNDAAPEPARAEIPSRVSYYADSIRRIKTPF